MMDEICKYVKRETNYYRKNCEPLDTILMYWVAF